MVKRLLRDLGENLNTYGRGPDGPPGRTARASRPYGREPLRAANARCRRYQHPSTRSRSARRLTELGAAARGHPPQPTRPRDRCRGLDQPRASHPYGREPHSVAALCPSVSHRPGAVRNQVRRSGGRHRGAPHRPGAVRNRPRGYPHSVPSFVPRPPHQPLPMVVHSPLWTTGLPDPGYPQGWAHPADPDQPAGYQPLPAPGACGKPAFPPLSQPVVRREHTSCGLPLPQRDRTSSSTAPLRRGAAPRHLTQEVVPTCGQLCGKTA